MEREILLILEINGGSGRDQAPRTSTCDSWPNQIRIASGKNQYFTGRSTDRRTRDRGADHADGSGVQPVPGRLYRMASAPVGPGRVGTPLLSRIRRSALLRLVLAKMIGHDTDRSQRGRSAREGLATSSDLCRHNTPFMRHILGNVSPRNALTRLVAPRDRDLFGEDQMTEVAIYRITTLRDGQQELGVEHADEVMTRSSGSDSRF